MFIQFHNLGGSSPNNLPRVFRNRNTGKYYAIVRNAYWLAKQVFVNIPVVLEYDYASKTYTPVGDVNEFKELLKKVKVEVKQVTNDNVTKRLVYDLDNTTGITEAIIESLNWNSNVIDISASLDYTGSNLIVDQLKEFKVVKQTDIEANKAGNVDDIPLIVAFMLLEPFGIVLNKDNFKVNSKYLQLYYLKGNYAQYHTDNRIFNSDSTVNCNYIWPFAVQDFSCLPNEYKAQILDSELRSYDSKLEIQFKFPESERLVWEFLANDNLKQSPVVQIEQMYGSNESIGYVKLNVTDNTGQSIEDIVGSNMYFVNSELDTLEKSENSIRKSQFKQLFIPKAQITGAIQLEHLINLPIYTVQFLDDYLLANYWTFRYELKPDNLVVIGNTDIALTIGLKSFGENVYEQTNKLFQYSALLTENPKKFNVESSVLFRLPNEPVDLANIDYKVYTGQGNAYVNVNVHVSNTDTNADTTADTTGIANTDVQFSKTLKYILFEKPPVKLITNLGVFENKDYQVEILDNETINLSFVLPESLVNEADRANTYLDQVIKAGYAYKPIVIKDIKLKT